MLRRPVGAAPSFEGLVSDCSQFIRPLNLMSCSTVRSRVGHLTPQGRFRSLMPGARRPSYVTANRKQKDENEAGNLPVTPSSFEGLVHPGRCGRAEPHCGARYSV